MYIPVPVYDSRLGTVGQSVYQSPVLMASPAPGVYGLGTLGTLCYCSLVLISVNVVLLGSIIHNSFKGTIINWVPRRNINILLYLKVRIHYSTTFASLTNIWLR